MNYKVQNGKEDQPDKMIHSVFIFSQRWQKAIKDDLKKENTNSSLRKH